MSGPINQIGLLFSEDNLIFLPKFVETRKIMNTTKERITEIINEYKINDDKIITINSDEIKLCIEYSFNEGIKFLKEEMLEIVASAYTVSCPERWGNDLMCFMYEDIVSIQLCESCLKRQALLRELRKFLK